MESERIQLQLLWVFRPTQSQGGTHSFMVWGPYQAYSEMINSSSYNDVKKMQN